jgi:hypothetical protein
VAPVARSVGHKSTRCSPLLAAQTGQQHSRPAAAALALAQAVFTEFQRTPAGIIRASPNPARLDENLSWFAASAAFAGNLMTVSPVKFLKIL